MFGLTVPSPLMASWAFPLAETTQKLEGRKEVDETPTGPTVGRDQVEKARQEIWRGKRRDPAQALLCTETI